jgi:phosphatidylglycerol---prolipoprotein diacylglyceryl transferase
MRLAAALPILHLALAYFILNIDPVLLRLGALNIHWYGLMYVVAIVVALWAVRRWAIAVGIHEEQLWGLFVWTAIAGLIGGRLYFVVQQPDLVEHYLLEPINIIAVWHGGMAFFGAIFAGTATLFFLARRYGLSPYIAIDGGALFAAVGQIFGRVGNIINGDILGQALSKTHIATPAGLCPQSPCIVYVSDPHYAPWAIVYLNTNSFASPGIPYLPAPVFEMGMNLIVLAILLPLRFRLPQIKAGFFFLLYFGLYGLTQLIVFFARGSEPIVSFLGTHILKQAQWTGIVVMLLCIPLYLYIDRHSAPWPYTAEHPVPWTPPGAEQKAPGATPPSGPSQPTAGVRRAAPAGPDASSGVTASQLNLPDWEPTRVSGGALRNVFGRHD